MLISGRRDGEPLLCPVPLASCADDLLLALNALAGKKVLGNVRGSELLTERAAFSGYRCHGRQSAGGSCRLLDTADGVVALNLPRASDWDLLPAWLQTGAVRNWQHVEQLLRARQTRALIDRGRLLGLAIVDALGEHPGCARRNQVHSIGTPCTPGRPAPRVVDLSSLWAGPLCSHLLERAGAEVIKVESTLRPDGARFGSKEFFDLLNHGKRSVALPLHTRPGQAQLGQLITTADIVIEGSRPRALQQMGLYAEELIREVPGLTWLSITGYGRQQPYSNWIAYGDDAGVAAGLSAILHEASGEWAFCGDAIADPITGLHGASAAWASWRSGGGQLLDISLYSCVRNCMESTERGLVNHPDRRQQWKQYLEQQAVEVCPAKKRPLVGAARELGADNTRVLTAC